MNIKFEFKLFEFDDFQLGISFFDGCIDEDGTHSIFSIGLLLLTINICKYK